MVASRADAEDSIGVSSASIDPGKSVVGSKSFMSRLPSLAARNEPEVHRRGFADPAADRLLAFLESGLMPVVDGGAPIPLAADSICVHGDGPAAVTMAGAIRARLGAAGVRIAPFLAG